MSVVEKAIAAETARQVSPGGNVSTFIETIVESSEDAIITKSLTGMVLSWNRAAEEMFGYSADEMVGESIMVLFPPDRVDEEKFMLNNIREGRRVKHFETLRLRKDGQPIPVSVTLSPIKDAEGRVIGAAKIARDISARVLLEQQARHYQAVIQSSFDAILTEGLDGIITTWNPAAEAIFGYSAQEIVGLPLSMIIPPELFEEEDLILRKVANGETVEPLDTVRCAKSGERLAVSVTASPIHGPDGKILGVSKIIRRMSDQRNAHQLLARNAMQFMR